MSQCSCTYEGVRCERERDHDLVSFTIDPDADEHRGTGPDGEQRSRYRGMGSVEKKRRVREKPKRDADESRERAKVERVERRADEAQRSARRGSSTARRCSPSDRARRNERLRAPDLPVQWQQCLMMLDEHGPLNAYWLSRRVYRVDGPLPPSQVATRLGQLAEAQCATELLDDEGNVVERDATPGNAAVAFEITDTGRVVLARLRAGERVLLPRLQRHAQEQMRSIAKEASEIAVTDCGRGCGGNTRWQSAKRAQHRLGRITQLAWPDHDCSAADCADRYACRRACRRACRLGEVLGEHIELVCQPLETRSQHRLWRTARLDDLSRHHRHSLSVPAVVRIQRERRSNATPHLHKNLDLNPNAIEIDPGQAPYKSVEELLEDGLDHDGCGLPRRAASHRWPIDPVYRPLNLERLIARYENHEAALRLLGNSRRVANERDSKVSVLTGLRRLTMTIPLSAINERVERETCDDQLILSHESHKTIMLGRAQFSEEP
jgi:hypothetical protein